jgi:hypothetical protein
MAKKIVLLVSGWENGSGWSYRNDVLESEKLQGNDPKELSIDCMWDYVLDALREKDDEELEEIAEAAYTDVNYEIQIIEYDEDDVFEDGNVIASANMWESELASKILEERQDV